MLKFKFYRAIKVMFGHRSFTKTSPEGTTTFVLLKGDANGKIISYMYDSGYIEEFV